jgi:hypothetical protein
VPFTGIYIVLKCTGGNKKIISAFMLCCGIARTEVIGQVAVLVVGGFPKYNGGVDNIEVLEDNLSNAT